MLHGRKRLMPALTGFAAVFSVALVPSAPTYAEPDIDDVQARVDKLYHQAEQATERHNDAKLKLAELKKDLVALKADAATQRAEVDEIQSVVDEAIAAQYEGQSLSATGELVLSDDPGEFLAEMTTLDAYNDVQSQAISDYARAAEALEIRQEAVEERAAELAATQKALAKEKAFAGAKLDEAQDLLADLKEEERQEFLSEASRGTTRIPSNVPVSGRRSTTRSARSATPTCTARPARTPSTAPASR